VTAWSGSQEGDLFGTSLNKVDLKSPPQVEAAFERARPEFIIHSAAIARADVCFADKGLAEQVNVRGTRLLADLAAEHRVRLVYVSTDLVFDGQQGAYREGDAAIPLSVYGRSKLTAERSVLTIPRSAVARVSLLFGPSLTHRPSFFDQQCSALRAGRPLTLFSDEWRTPLSLATAARALVELADSPVTGVIHVGGAERLSRWEMGQKLAETIHGDPAVFVAGRQSDATLPEPRPRDVSLDSSRWRSLFPQHPWPKWDEAMVELGCH
jgi:dTDP-4-dehydrorhamnose reductase